MGRKKDETHTEFKKRVIDEISPSFCAAKWYNATIWLGHGQTTSCHHPPGHYIPEHMLKDNPSVIHNTKHKKRMRKMMLEGGRPKECEYCWKIEDIGRNNISDRVYKTEIFSDDDIFKASKMDWQEDVNLRTLEISFDRLCNFACSYCNPAFSTTWVKDIHKYGPYKDIASDGRGHYIDDAQYAKGYEGKSHNPFVNAFWEWWDNGLSDSLHEIRITGGEPLLSPGTWKLFEWYENNPDSNIKFAVNSNLCPVNDKLITKLIEKSHHVKHLEIYTSCESYGKHANYIRDGLDYDKWKKNIHNLIQNGNINRLHMMMTINSLCLASITEFMDDMIEIKKQYGPRFPIWTLNILRFPSFQAPAILPLDLKLKEKEKLEKWLKEKRENPIKMKFGDRDEFLISDMELDQVQRLIDYLETVTQPHRNTAAEEDLFHDFKAYYYQYDKRRGKDFLSTFPKEFTDFYNSIDIKLPEDIFNKDIEPVRLSDGDPATMENYDEGDQC